MFYYTVMIWLNYLNKFEGKNSLLNKGRKKVKDIENLE